MTETCPVCGDRVEHVRVESGEDGTSGGAVTFDIDDLCSVADDTRWDRICTAVGDGTGPILEVYYHFFEE